MMVLFIDFLHSSLLCSRPCASVTANKAFQVFAYVAGWCLVLDSYCLCWICIDWKTRSYSTCYFLMYTWLCSTECSCSYNLSISFCSYTHLYLAL